MKSVTVFAAVIIITFSWIITKVRTEEQPLLIALISADETMINMSNKLAIRRKRNAEGKQRFFDLLTKNAILKRKKRSSWLGQDPFNRATITTTTVSTTPSSTPPPTTPA